jgi:hypothetical protein
LIISSHFIVTSAGRELEEDVPAKKVKLESPTKFGSSLLDSSLAVVSFDKVPLSLLDPTFQSPFWLLGQNAMLGMRYIQSASDLTQAAKYYPTLTQFVPNDLEYVTRQPITNDTRVLSSLFPTITEASVHSLPRYCQPEVFVTVPVGECKAPFTAKGEGFGDGGTVFDEMVIYSLGGLIQSYFSEDRADGARRFYRVPPIGFALVAPAYMGHLMLIEWVGQLRMTPISNPFFLGSEEHRTAIQRISDLCSGTTYTDRYADPVIVDVASPGWQHWAEGVSTKLLSEGKFVKMIRPRRHLDFEKLYRVYEKYQSLYPLPKFPRQLIQARLLFGQFAVLVEMDAIGCIDATEADFETEVIVQDIASAIVYLARNGLIYIDFRETNVRIDNNGRAHLIDYDDMILGANCDTYHMFFTTLTAQDYQVYLDNAKLLAAIEHQFNN